MRPKGSKDKKKRKVKKILNGIEERLLIEDYQNGECTKNLIEKYKVTKSYISLIFKRRGICFRIDPSCISKWEKVDDPNYMEGGISGVYAIYFIHNINSNNIKLYIGSSVDISNRLQDHSRHLNQNTHSSQNLKNMFCDRDYSIRYAIIERCDPDSIMQKEAFYLSRWSKSCLLNTWRPNSDNEMRPWLEAAVKRDAYAKNYIINKDTGCKESLCVHKRGYASMKVVIGNFNNIKGDAKYLYKHRVAYWEKHGEYPELVRHLCDNPKCYNADHLVKGNHRDNALDKRGDFPEEFESKWLEFGANLYKLSDYYADRWVKNMELSEGKVSRMVYEWEKKLGLRKKYPDIIRNNSSRRYNGLVIREV
jgi:hypothetical protein